MSWLVRSWLLLLLGCEEPRPAAVPNDQGTAISLMAVDPAVLVIPQDSRGGVAPPADVTLGTWQDAGTTPGGMHKWSIDLPIRPRGLFFHEAEPGIVLRPKGGQPLRYARGGKSADAYWWHNKHVLFLYLPESAPPPKPGDFVFSYPKSTEREKAMNFGFQPAGTLAADFVKTSVHHDWNTRTGLLLPAPATAAWDLDVPVGAELLMAPGLAEPELLDGPPSDGATLVVTVEVGGQRTEVARIELEPGVFPPTRLDLSRWGGQAARLEFVVDPGASPAFDYAFLGNPVVSSRKENPRRVVMVFIDTLRADHLGVYGYHRDTSRGIDAWAQQAAVFEQARSVAPWTLPSGRAIVTGRAPEYYAQTASVQKVLGDLGFVSAMIAGNVYLSDNFDMARDWGWHKVGMWPRAETITDDALDFLDTFDGHDAVIQVHYMDCHLPYLEPRAYRKLFAGQGAPGLGEEFHLPDVRAANTKNPAVRQYVMDRYDNNVRYATDEVGRLLSHLDENDVVLLYADHGEEFWDHGGFEHGHQLFDELLHVPLIVDGPGVDGVRVTAPASLLDLTPTILDALDVADPEPTRDGVSLWPVARGEAELPERELAFGRPLYGEERWGVLTTDRHKWMTYDGAQQAYDLTADPGEKTDLLRGRDGSAAAPYHQALGRALDTPAGPAYRVFASALRKAGEHDVEVTMVVPGGVRHAWVEYDPIGRAFADPPVVGPVDETGAQTVTITWRNTSLGQGTVWVVPELPFDQVTRSLVLTARSGDVEAPMPIPAAARAEAGTTPVSLASAGIGGRQVRVSFGIGPVPRPEWVGVDATDEEMSAELTALGYQHDDRD